MIIQKAALRPVPAYAVIDASAIHQVEEQLDDDDDILQESLDRGFASFDREQPVLAHWLAEHLADVEDELVQSLGYFLVVTVYMTFREAFPTRLASVDEDALRLSDETLSADEELRATDPSEVLDSDDVLAMRQPALISYIQHHVDEALEQSEGEVDLEELEETYRAVLVEVIALTDAVAPSEGERSQMN